MLKFKTFNFDLKFCWNWSFFHYEKIMRFKKWPQLPGAGRIRAGHPHGSHTPTSPEAILLGKMAHHTKQIQRECICINLLLSSFFQTFFWSSWRLWAKCTNSKSNLKLNLRAVCISVKKRIFCETLFSPKADGNL